MTDPLRRLRLPHLRLLGALDEEEKLVRAAERLGVSQPAVSRLAAEIEAIFGVPLTRREGRGVALTPEGRSLARRARRILVEIDRMGREVDELRAGLSGTVRVGSVTGPAVDVVLPAIRALRLSHPGIEVRIDVATSDVLMSGLLGGAYDLVLARPAATDAGRVNAILAAAEPVALAVREGHPLAGQPALMLVETLGQDWILPFEGTILRSVVEAALAAEGLGLPRRVLSTSSFLVTLTQLGRTNAVAPLAASVVEAFATTGVRALDLRPAIAVPPWSLVWPAGTEPPPAASVLLELIRSRLGSGIA